MRFVAVSSKGKVQNKRNKKMKHVSFGGGGSPTKKKCSFHFFLFFRKQKINEKGG